MNVLRTVIIPAAYIAKARIMGAELTPAGAGMYLSGLSASGALPATHYVSSGMIRTEFAVLLTDPVALFAAAQAGAAVQGIAMTSTQTDANNLVANAIVHDGTYNGNPETPHELFARLNLYLLTEGV